MTVLGSAHYYVRSEGWERCADCQRRWLEDLHAEALDEQTVSKKRELLKTIKMVEDECKKTRKHAKSGIGFNRIEHGCLCCTYEGNYGEGQLKVTQPITYWFEKQKGQKLERAANKHMSQSRKK